MHERNRRSLLKGAAVAAATAATAGAQSKPTKKAFRTGPKPATPPPFSAAVSYGNLLFVSGIGYRQQADIKVQVEAVINDLKTQLEAAGSSLDKVLKTTVYLADAKYFAAMNEVYTGKFGDDPPARTTAFVSGLPGNSQIEIEAVAFI